MLEMAAGHADGESVSVLRCWRAPRGELSYDHNSHRNNSRGTNTLEQTATQPGQHVGAGRGAGREGQGTRELGGGGEELGASGGESRKSY